MIYYATVHWKNADWIDIQLKMLKRYTAAPYKVYAFLNEVDRIHYDKFNRVMDDPISLHSRKLDLLAEQIAEEAADSDWIVFIDGDAYPLRDVFKTINPLLGQYPLAAIQRPENLGEKQPHPSFCVTTVGFWREIEGTWSKGYRWINAMGYPDTDVGGNLLEKLEQRGINWYPILRSNTINLHPVFFGIYGNLIYHHGAGFRTGAGRQAYFEAGLYEIYKRIDARILNNIVPRKYVVKMRDSLLHPEGRRKRKIYRALEPVKQEVRAMIEKDPESVRQFTASAE